MAAKRSINRKAIQEIAQRELAAGKTREAIIEELSEQYYDKKTLESYVGSVPDPDLRARYNTANTLLFVLLLSTALLKLLLVLSLALQSGKSPLLFLLVPILPLINIWLAIEVRKARGYIYWPVFVLALLGLSNSFRDMSSSGIETTIEIALLVTIAGLSLYIVHKMFPHLRFGRPVPQASTKAVKQ